MKGLTQTAADTTVVPTWEELAKVGFESLKSYQHWCRLSGMDGGLDREQPANWLEHHLAEALVPKRPLTEKRQQTLEQLAGGELPSKGFVVEWLGQDAEAHKAFQRLILHIDGFMNVIPQHEIRPEPHCAEGRRFRGSTAAAAQFTMKGRSATKLLRQVEAWHGHLSREEYVNFQSWQPCGIRPWELEDEMDELGKVRWTVQELLSSWELAAEGRAMHHCVVSYSDQCADGNTAIWLIGALQEGAEEREHVLTVALDIKGRTVTQARGRYNAVPNKPPKSGKIRNEVQGGYLRLLNRSEHIMQEWMQRECLRRDD